MTQTSKELTYHYLVTGLDNALCAASQSRTQRANTYQPNDIAQIRRAVPDIVIDDTCDHFWTNYLEMDNDYVEHIAQAHKPMPVSIIGTQFNVNNRLIAIIPVTNDYLTYLQDSTTITNPRAYLDQLINRCQAQEVISTGTPLYPYLAHDVTPHPVVGLTLDADQTIPVVTSIPDEI